MKKAGLRLMKAKWSGLTELRFCQGNVDASVFHISISLDFVRFIVFGYGIISLFVVKDRSVLYGKKIETISCLAAGNGY